jgi:hypothetical protein
MSENKVSILSVLKNENFEKIIISDEYMILIRIIFNNTEYSLWLNKVSETSYSIGNDNLKLSQDFYSNLFDILKKNRDNIEEAKNRILELLIRYK